MQGKKSRHIDSILMGSINLQISLNIFKIIKITDTIFCKVENFYENIFMNAAMKR